MLTDAFGRHHTYLRLSLTERCNLRCFYCMPPEGISLSPRDYIMRTEEVEKIARVFVNLGVNKIRLTGGEPLVRKDAADIIERLSALPVTMGITTNGILLDEYLPVLKKCKVSKINVSLDTLNKERFETITRRDFFDRVTGNIGLMQEHGIHPKINVVLIKGVNDDEIIPFINLTTKNNVTVQFIEFMPFLGNQWDRSRCISSEVILHKAFQAYGQQNIIAEDERPHNTARFFRVKGFNSRFGIISTITNPFCDGCNRLRLTANGHMKNCLFSQDETDLLTPLRNGKPIEPLISENISRKNRSRGGISDFSHPEGKINTQKNRSMILIGG